MVIYEQKKYSNLELLNTDPLNAIDRDIYLNYEACLHMKMRTHYDVLLSLDVRTQIYLIVHQKSVKVLDLLLVMITDTNVVRTLWHEHGHLPTTAGPMGQ